MLPEFKRLESVSIFTSNLQRAANVYLELGLERCSAGEAPVGDVPLRFAGGGTELVLHDDPMRQFVELTVEVDDVEAVYGRLVRHPDYTWLETPHLVGADWRAVVRLPDDNVFTIRSAAVRPAEGELAMSIG